MAKVGGAVGLIGSKINVFQDILNLLHQISMKLWGNVLGMKKMKTDEFGHMFAYSCPGMPINKSQIGPYLVPKYTFFNISRIWFIRFSWNFEGMFLVWKEWRLMSSVACSAILARTCSLVFILFMRRTCPQSFVKGTFWDQVWPKWWAWLGKNGRTCDQTDKSSLLSYHEHFLKVSSKSDNKIQDILENVHFRPN